MWIADVVVLILFGWAFAQDGFRALNEWADEIEKLMPIWFRWEARGNWITWIHHTLWALLITSVGALIGWLTGDWHQGAQHFSLIAAGFYVIREWLGFREAKRFYFDGLMDQAGPVLVALEAWRL